MKNQKLRSLTIVAILGLTSLVSSAQVTVTKRKHSPGFHIEMFSKRHNNKVAVENNSTTVVSTVKPEVSKEVVLPAVESPSLTFSDNSTASAKPIVTNVVAKKTAKQHAKMAKLIAKKQASTVKADKKVEKMTKKAIHTSRRGGIDWIAFGLCLLGFITAICGLHRFYMGYIWQGIVQLLTFGGCGIWLIIDLIRICTGDLTEK